MKKENLKNGDKVLYVTLGLIQPGRVMENDVANKLLKIKVDGHNGVWTEYNYVALTSEEANLIDRKIRGV